MPTYPDDAVLYTPFWANDLTPPRWRDYPLFMALVKMLLRGTVYEHNTRLVEVYQEAVLVRSYRPSRKGLELFLNDKWDNIGRGITVTDDAGTPGQFTVTLPTALGITGEPLERLKAQVRARTSPAYLIQIAYS